MERVLKPANCLSMVHSSKQHVPLLMFLGRDRPAAGKRFIQQFNAGHTQNGKLAPVRQRTAAAIACDLVSKEVRRPFLNAIVLRLHDSIFIVIAKAQQPSLMNRRQDQLMDSGIHIRGRRMPYYPKQSTHPCIMRESEPVNDTAPRLS